MKKNNARKLSSRVLRSHSFTAGITNKTGSGRACARVARAIRRMFLTAIVLRTSAPTLARVPRDGRSPAGHASCREIKRRTSALKDVSPKS